MVMDANLGGRRMQEAKKGDGEKSGELLQTSEYCVWWID